MVDGEVYKTVGTDGNETVKLPKNPTKEGYTFKGWYSDNGTWQIPFTANSLLEVSLSSDMNVYAKWMSNTIAECKVEYYHQNLDKNGYDLVHTDTLSVAIGSNVSAEIKNYDHFTYNSYRSKTSGIADADGSLVLKIYYDRNNYTMNLSSSSYSKGTVYPYSMYLQPYGTEITVSATPYPGYNFSGWFNGSDKLSSEATYTFNVSGNLDLVAEFEPISEMEGYTFYSTENSCTLLKVNDKTVSDVVIPNCVTEIYSDAFKDCLNLESITIPNSVTTIGSSAFSGCISLESIIIPNSVTDIELMIFQNCTSLKNVTLPNNINEIPCSMFEGCSSLESIVIPNGVTKIEAFAFQDCKKLTQITIPDSVTSIELAAFSNCSELSSLALPNNITEIADSMFRGCSKLSSIIIPEKVMSIGSSAFKDCTSLNSIIIPDKVKKIKWYAFQNCTNLTSITLKNKSGWTANGNSISSSELEDKSTAANYFKNTYYDDEWTRS